MSVAPKAAVAAPTHPRRPIAVPGPAIPARVEINIDKRNMAVVTIATEDGQRLTMDARQFMRLAEQVVRSLSELTPD